MPLLHRRPFVRQKPPPDLKPDEEVFLCKVTHEIFRTYDEFFERTILCNSLVWSCAVTGRPGLTYQEAEESEKRARQSLQSFPPALLVPILHLVTLTHRTRLHEICDDIHSYVKERFFEGETVDVMGRMGVRQPCRILEVQSPHFKGDWNGHIKHRMEGDAIVISDSDDEGSAISVKSPKPPLNGKKKASVNPSVFKYKVLPLKVEGCEPFIVKASQMSRKKNVFSRDRLKLLLKMHCEPQNGTIRLKTTTIAKFKLAEHNFSHFFPDEPPVFPFVSPGKGRTRPHNGSPGGMSFISEGGSMMHAAEEKLRLLQQKEEMMTLALEKAKLKREREDAWEARKREKEDKERKREELKRLLEEEKQKRREEKERMKLEKEKEREKLREEKKKYAERLKLWSKPREDMECEDLKELPAALPVKTRLPPELFGDALMVLEFLQAFGELFDLKDEFPDGITLEVLEEALVGCDPEGPLCELLFFFLSAIFQALAEEEEEVAREQVAEADSKDLSEALDEDADPTQSALSAVASLAAAWPQLYQGCSLKQLDLDSCTLSEILRLHILSSGADCNSTNAKFRYQKQGGFSATDDACVELRLTNPGLLKRLSCTAVYDLLPGEKLKILHALCGKLLTLVSTRDFIEDCADEQRQAKQELRELKAEQHRREREEAANRIRKKKEEKLKELELKLKEKHEKLREDEERNPCHESQAAPEMGTSMENHEGLQESCREEKDEQTLQNKGKKVKGNSEKMKPVEALDPVSTEEQRQKERELQERIQRAAACTYILPLGRDRLYRRYWLFTSAPGLFVEDDFSGLTEDMLLPQPPTPLELEAVPSPATPKTPPQDDEDSTSEDCAPAPAVRSSAPPVIRPNLWAFYSSPHEVEQLIEALNPRGHRESSLKEALLQERQRINHYLSSCPAHRFHHLDKPESESKAKQRSAPVSAERSMESRLRDLLLDIEDRIYQGTLGSVKAMERNAWREALESSQYELLGPDMKENGVAKRENAEDVAMEIEYGHFKAGVKDRLQELKSESLSATSTSSSTPQPINNSVHYLALALAQIEQGMERRFLKTPLGCEDGRKDQKIKKREKKRDDDQSSEKDDGSESSRACKTVQERWRESLLGCSSLSQVFLHLSTLERSIIWAKSILNARCKLCRRKGDAENMMLCDACERGHHIHCVRPKLKAVPTEEWFCPECRPKKRSHRLGSRQRSSVDSDEELESEDEEEDEEESEEEEGSGEEDGSEDDDEEEEEDDEEDDDEEEEEEEEQESPPKKGHAAVKLPVTKKGGRASGKSVPRQLDSSRSATRSHQTTPKQSLPSRKATAKNSGKKVAAPAPPRAQPRPGSRTSGRLSQELQAANGSFTSCSPSTTHDPRQADTRKRPVTEVSPKARVVLTAPSSSSNRRSSGRNHGVHELSACEQMIIELVRHEDSWPFMKLVTKTQVPDYYDIIKKPMALSIIRERVNNCEYKTTAEFIADVELMFTNCLEYNPRHTNEAKAGVRLQAFFHSEAQKLGLPVPPAYDQTNPPQKRPRM